MTHPPPQPPASALPSVEEIRGRAVRCWRTTCGRGAGKFYERDASRHHDLYPREEGRWLLLADFKALLARAEGKS